jgi:hypothetical protein
MADPCFEWMAGTMVNEGARFDRSLTSPRRHG